MAEMMFWVEDFSGPKPRMSKIVGVDWLFFGVIAANFAYVPLSNAIRCYKCSLTRTNLYATDVAPLCSEFDYSDRFIVDCPESTFCVKKSYRAKIAGLINGTARFCAYQKYESHRVVNGKWMPRVTIEEPYSENCTVIDDQGLKTGWTEECYCKTELCNGSIRYKGLGRPLLLLLSTVIMIIIPLII